MTQTRCRELYNTRSNKEEKGKEKLNSYTCDVLLYLNATYSLYDLWQILGKYLAIYDLYEVKDILQIQINHIQFEY